ncbi:class I SAM-dependent methyltransferase [Nocardioides deserti]|uniref:Class I SAM-dependent methyltransferase n=2 Tax=Nocardioides deserti TaxID=1588644 RepID=A0ABR6U6B8_9ACTN|nr:class I SAM-dependent methyltransferase [Nocardioides deserti]
MTADLPVRLTAYDGSAAGPRNAHYGLHLRNGRGLAYLMTAPGDLGFARAYVSGDLTLTGAHPGDPYAVMSLLMSNLEFRRPGVVEAARIVRALGVSHLKPPPPPPQEQLPRWRRAVEGLRASMSRDAGAIQHHYDVSNRFYELVLGPSMAYTCAVFADDSKSLEEAQTEKFDLICRKLDLRPGQRLLDVGCGWGGLVRHAATEYGVRALGVTLSLEQAHWAKEALDRDGLSDLAEVRHLDYRTVMDSDFDAVSSIGMMEHVGVRNYPTYFSFLRDKLVPGGRLLNHCITRSHNRPTRTGAFIDRYVFPDGELAGSGTVVGAAQDAGLEVQHTENLRPHYARTLAAWSRNLATNWEECVAEVGVGTSRVWGVYMAGSRIAFERDEIELHQVLATRNDDRGASGFPLRPNWRV